ncbi:sel1 repeat family protein [Rhodobacteraceae bacterium CCMM004]|nr:sel1 repeat family protein [Rhodobacteraceae bacterium CCMM004]
MTMKRIALALTAAALVAPVLAPLPAAARTLDLAFRPPALEPQDICRPETREKALDLVDIDPGVTVLSDRMRAAYLRRDIRRLKRTAPDAEFAFIEALIQRLSEVDASFDGNRAILERVALYIDAGRLDALRAAGLVGELRQRHDLLDHNQRLILAQYYLNGIGVDPDPDYARALIRDAGFGGNANALMTLARMELEGNPVEGWDAPLDLTVTMAFGGLLGQFNASVCNRAERIARQYLDGEVVSPNPRLAYDWYKFSADMGSARGAWRVVEFHLEADAADKDDAQMLKYLGLALERGFSLSEEQIGQLKVTGGVGVEELLATLGYNHAADTGRHRRSLSPLFQLAINLDGEEADEDSTYLLYLRELTEMPEAPGWVFTTLAKETLVRVGRWKGEPEAMALLEEAVRRGDPEGTQLLAQKLVRWRDDPARIGRSIDLFHETVSRWGMESSMEYLDGLYRCQVNDAPRMRAAGAWAASYAATEHGSVSVSATDLIALDPYKEPEIIARIQSQALMGRTESLANFVQRVQVDPGATGRAHRLWAERLDRSDQALEAFAKLEFELATNPAERRLAVELFRRIYLNNGVKTALDLAIALTDDNGRDVDIADEVIDLLTMAGKRGEGAAMRLKSRLLAKVQGERAVYDEFAAEIEDRGDFLALVFAIPYVDPETAADYVDRAVSLMRCTTKDVAELGEAHAKRGEAAQSYHWRRIGLAIEGGHALSKLRLKDRQLAAFDTGAVPTEMQVLERSLAEGDAAARQRLFLLTANPDLETWAPEAAAEHLLAAVQGAAYDDLGWILAAYRRAAPEVQAAVSDRFDVHRLYAQAADAGDVTAARELGLLLRDTAETPADLLNSARWLEQAAEAGDRRGMAEFGHALAYGIGIAPDMGRALAWLDQASEAGSAEADRLARLLRLTVTQ